MRGVNWDVVSDFRPGASRTRHPFEVFTLVLALTSGLTVTLGSTESNAISKALPHWAQMLWGVCLLAGSALALVGVWWPRRITGIITEQIGLVMVGFATIFYAICILKFAGFSTGGLAVAYILGFGLSCIWRWAQLEQLLHILRKMESGEYRLS